jgi:hypothetical protein
LRGKKWSIRRENEPGDNLNNNTICVNRKGVVMTINENVLRDDADYAERKRYVKQYLSDNGISAKFKGYYALVYVILYAADNPQASCKELFESYTNSGESFTNNYKLAYKTANYAIKSVPALSKKTIFEFIKDCATSIEH